MRINDIFALQRIESTVGAILIFAYLPLGSVLLLFRLFVTLNFLCSQIVFNSLCSPKNVIRRFMEKIILAILGVFVVERKSEIKDPKSIAVANNVSRFDHVAVSALCNYTSVDQCVPAQSLKKLLRIELLTQNKDDTIKRIKALLENRNSVICFPQLQPTNNKGLMKFSEWPFTTGFSIQPIAIRAKRLLPIAYSTIDSMWWQDLLWTYFSLITVYDFTYLPPVAMQSGEDASCFAERVREIIADELGVPCTNFTSADVKEYLKRLRFEARKPQQHLPESRNTQTTQMAKQVKDILPHVPLAVIIKDVEKTQSIDVTVANLLEGVVKFVPEENRPSTSSTSRSNQAKTPPNVGQKSFSRNPSDRHLSLQERKEAFVKRAREAYLKKHGFM